MTADIEHGGSSGGLDRSGGDGSSAKPKVLFATNQVPDWSHEMKTRAIARHLYDRYEVSLRFKEDLTEEDLIEADIVALHSWRVMHPLNDWASVYEGIRHKLLIGLTAPLPEDPDERIQRIRVTRNYAAGVFVVNRRIQRELRPFLGAPVFYTPNGVDTEFFEPDHRLGPPAGPLRVGWAGSLSNLGKYYRGVPNLLEPAVAAVAGAELDMAVREDRWRTTEEMLEYHRSIDVYVCASRAEGVPNPPLEAAACGVPIITTPVGVMPEFIVDGVNGFLVPHDVGALADRIRRLQEDPQLRVRVGRRARDTALMWDWRYMSERYAFMFDWLLDADLAV